MFDDFFTNKRVLITGVAGVKGTWLALELLDLASSIIGLDNRYPANDSNFTFGGLHDRIDFVTGDVTELDTLARVMDGVDCVFHLAAISLVGEARRNPWETYRSNTFGTASVLEAMRLSSTVTDAVIVTTDKVYKSKQGELWKESDELFATEPYPISKACAEQIVLDYYRHYLRPAGKRVGVARAGNVLLGGDPYSSARLDGGGHLHVDCIEALAEGRPPEVFTPAFTRPYTYGLDILTGYMSLMSRLSELGVDGEAFNFGPHERQGVENGLIATKICQIWGGNLMWKASTPRPEPFERQSISWEKAHQRLGWQPAYTLYETLEQVCDWYRAWAKQDRLAGCMEETNRLLIQRHREAAAKMAIWWAKSDRHSEREHWNLR